MTFEYTWGQFDTDAKAIADALRKSGMDRQLKYVYGIPRGGVVLACYLSHTLGLAYVGGDFAAASLDPARVLVVDDNTITGETLAPYVAGRFATAALVGAYTACISPSYLGRVVAGWPVFPWEKDSCVEFRGHTCAAG